MNVERPHVYLWITPDDPVVVGPFPNYAEAYDAAYQDWVSFQGGIVGGFEHGTRKEFNEAYATTSKLWIAPLSTPDAA